MIAKRDEKFDRVRHIVQERRDLDHRRIREMIAAAERYEGDYVVPVPDIEGKEQLPVPVPFLLTSAIDNTAMRAASLLPTIHVPALTSDGVTTEAARDYAVRRRKFLYSVWDRSALPLMLYRVFRHYAGYGSMSWVVMPDFKERRPRIHARDPLTAYPEPRDPEDLRAPGDCAFVYGRTVEWLAKNYPETRPLLSKYARGEQQLWDVFEWIDGEEIIIGLLGPRSPDWITGAALRDGADMSLPLHRWENRAGVCTAVAPFRVTLRRVMSQVQNAIPANDLWAKLMTLDVVAAEQAIFGDKYAIAQEGRTPEIISHEGRWQPGVTGAMNLLKDVRAVGILSSGPGPAAQPVIDRMERATMINAGGTPQMHGESGGQQLRTARALDTMTQFAVDPRVQEIHTVAEYALQTTNEQVLAVAEGYWPRRKMWVFSGLEDDLTGAEFEPAKHTQTAAGGRRQVVKYPFPGLDKTQTSLQLLQLVGGGLESRKHARAKHPDIGDPDETDRQIQLERLMDAIGVGTAQQIAGGEMLIQDALVLVDEMQRGASLQDAIRAAQAAAQRRQEEQQRAQQMDPTAAEAQAGLQPAAPAEQAAAANMNLAAVPPPTTSQERLRMLFSAIRARA